MLINFNPTKKKKYDKGAKCMKRTNLMLKILCAVLSASVIFGAFAGCGNKIHAQKEQSVDEIDYSQFNENTEATLKISIQAYDNEEVLIRSVAENFNQKYPKVQIKIDRMSGELSSTLMSYYNAEANAPGTMPDIWFSTSFNMLALSQKPIMLNMDTYLQAAKNQNLFNEADYVPQYWTLGKKNFTEEQLMIPRSADRVVVHTNVDIIKKAQTWCTNNNKTDADFLSSAVGTSEWITSDYIENPADPVDLNARLYNGWTWEDYLYVLYWCRQYYDAIDNTAAKGFYLVDAYLNWEANYNPMFQAMGVQYFDEKGNFITDTAKWQKAMDMMKFLIDQGFSAPFKGGSAGFTGGKGVFLIHSQAMAISLQKLQALDAYKNVSDMSQVFDIYTFPLIEYNNTPKIGAGIAGYSVYRNSKNRELAMLFLLDVISAKGQTAMAQAGINYPSIRVDMQNTEAPWAANYSDYNMEAYIWGQEYTCATDYFLAHAPEYASDIMEAVQTMISAYGDGTKTLSAVLTNCKDDIDYYLSF